MVESLNIPVVLMVVSVLAAAGVVALPGVIRIGTKRMFDCQWGSG